MNFKALALSAIVATTAIVGGTAAQAYGLDLDSCGGWGNSISCSGSDGSSFNSTTTGDLFSDYDGNYSNGDSFSGSCYRIGNNTFCN